jgi:hypothetical protein
MPAARARIFKQRKSAMQSGHAKEDGWILEWERTEAKRADSIMGWWGSGDMMSQLRLKFDTREEAEAYAAREGITYELELVPDRITKPKAYADNFKFSRSTNWTH